MNMVNPFPSFTRAISPSRRHNFKAIWLTNLHRTFKGLFDTRLLLFVFIKASLTPALIRIHYDYCLIVIDLIICNEIHKRGLSACLLPQGLIFASISLVKSDCFVIAGFICALPIFIGS